LRSFFIKKRPLAILLFLEILVKAFVETTEVPMGVLITDPEDVPVYTLAELLDQMTPETFPEEVDFGPPVGEEVW